MSLKGKVCSKCNEHKPLSEFTKRTSAKDGLEYQCTSCKKEYNDNYDTFKRWWDNKTSSTKKRGIEFPIEPEDIPGVKIRETITEAIGRNRYGTFPSKYISWEATEYPKVCLVLGIKLDWGRNGCNNNSPSLDRINPKLGYIKGNVRIISNLANTMKSNATPEQKLTEARYYLFGNKEVI